MARRLDTRLLFYEFLRIFWYSLISQGYKSKVVPHFEMELVYTVFISNNRASLHFQWKVNFIKCEKVSKFYENDSVQNFPFLFMSSSTVIRNSYISARIFFIFLKTRPKTNLKDLIYNFKIIEKIWKTVTK